MRAMSEAKTHAGGCHCGKVRYEVKLDLGNPVIGCNCSMCAKVGSLLSFVPAGDFKLLSGEDSLTDYLFNKHAIHHLFCKSCGIKSFARGTKPDGTQMVAINVRALDDFDLTKVNVKMVDGKSA
jgi:hypothetical protein